MPTLLFEEVARLPEKGDNAAIATRNLHPGTQITYQDRVLILNYSVLEGHRFAVRPIKAGEYLTSWGVPFGIAREDIPAGGYLVNTAVLQEFARRMMPLILPTAPNFSDQLEPYKLDKMAFKPAAPLPRAAVPATFMGYRRPGRRGAGTRNYIVLLGTSALAGSFVRKLESFLAPLAEEYPHIDGIVAVAHTEGAHESPNNRELLLRTLAGFFVHANVGAVLAVDFGSEAVTNEQLETYMREHRYPLEDIPHAFLSLTQGFAQGQTDAGKIVRGWLPQVNAAIREAIPLSELKIILQCGGSDAFSGISGNPLAAWVAKQVIENGGSANLAETDELIGAEAYLLNKVRDLATAEKFLAAQKRFSAWASRYGASVHGNPSGGNKFRGLYNIYLKSLGAATKRHPDVPLDQVIDYAEPMTAPGFYFMDSPGNDLESIAGQVASGGNLIFFVTGNGSVTNFPFVPTIKIVTTTARYELLANDMDVNAGAFLDGTPLHELGQQTFDLALKTASGERTAGEYAGHSQVQIWRDWPKQQPHVPGAAPEMHPSRVPSIPNNPDSPLNVGLIIPTSLCAGQIAQMAANRLNKSDLSHGYGVSRFVALVHTEGCGCSDEAVAISREVLLNYTRHPHVRACLLLEHGCEKTHNADMRLYLAEMGVDPDSVGWASVQLDGGIAPVIDKIETYFRSALYFERKKTGPLLSSSLPGYLSASRTDTSTLTDLRLGILSVGPIAQSAATQLVHLVHHLDVGNTTLVIPDGDPLLQHPNLSGRLPLIPFASAPGAPGMYRMENPSRGWTETLTGLGATGVETILAYAPDFPRPVHPFVPVLQVTSPAQNTTPFLVDFDLMLARETAPLQLGTGELAALPYISQILSRIRKTLEGTYIPRTQARGLIDFQITRGQFGITL